MLLKPALKKVFRQALDRVWERTAGLACRLALAAFVMCSQGAQAAPGPAAPALQSSTADCPPPPEQDYAEAFQKAMRHPADHGFLWSISKSGHTSYLYGTLHAAKAEWMAPGPTLIHAFSAADTVALEMDLGDAAVREHMLALMSGDHGAALPPPLAARLRKMADALCAPSESLGRISPALQVATLSAYAGRRDGIEAAYGIDLVLAGMGHAAGKRMVSLETPERQLQALQFPDPRDNLSFVRNGLQDLESGRARSVLLRLATAWADSNYAELAHYDQWCECLATRLDRGLMARMLQGRNPGMAEKIDALHSSGRQVLAAVGSAHMFGPTGLPRLMAERGYIVERVSAP